MERGFLSQQGSGMGRGVKEKNVNGNKMNTSSGIGVSTESDNTMNEDTPVGVTSAVQECVTPSIEKEKQSSLEDTTDLGSFPPLPTHVITSAGNAPGKPSYANAAGKSNGKKLNIRTLFTLRGSRIDMVRVSYPVVTNYVRNTWGKFGLVRSMFSASTGLFSFQFISMDGLDAMLENGPSDDGLSANATKLADVELKENIIVAMPKITREGHYTCNVCVEYEWKPPRCSSCKVFGHIHEECLKNTGAGEKKTMKKPSQASRGVLVGPKMTFKPQKEYRPVTKKPNTSSSCNKKKGVEPTIEVSKSNPFDVLNSIDNKMEFGKLRLLDNDGNPLVPTGIMESDSELEVLVGTMEGFYLGNDDYDPYDDDMYENHDLSEHLQSICDDLDITVRGRKKK
ncbi:hypothetical protein Tco_1255107 [Tanacetum coccineum]